LAYIKTPKGRIINLICKTAWQKSSKGRKSKADYKKSPKGRATELAYNKTPKRKSYLVKYENTPKRMIYKKIVCAKRRAAKRSRMPKWADLNVIKQFYVNCPKGMVVDHIIPLQGKLVSGLHVENNLQYLTPIENDSKGNKFNLIEHNKMDMD
jgi:5-methylcytosine-specific restriction endonuclease McrA